MSADDTSRSGVPAPGGDERQRTVDALCEAFADDRLTLEEFERRVEIAHAAGSEAALRELLSDLPAVHRQPTRRPDDEARDPARRKTGAELVRADDDRAFSLPPMARPDEVAEQGYVIGIMGGAGRSGRWIPARRTTAVGMMGGVELDYRDAVFPPGVTEVRVVAFWGGVELIVPPGVRVDCSGIGIMGGFEETYTVPPTSNPDAPILRVRGVAVMGGMDLTVRYPGETGREARRRLKEEKREMRRLKRGE